MQAELIADYECRCGEGPLWHHAEQRLYWADIARGRMFRYDPGSGRHEMFYEGEAMGGFTIQEDGALLLFGKKGAVKILCDGRQTTIVEDIPEERDSRFNDVIADPEGRVFCGTMPTKDRPGRLYRLDIDGSVVRVVDKVTGSNGLGFTPDRKRMYYSDSFDHCIYLFDYDRDTGAIANQRVFVHVTPEDGFPDGMTVDAEGFVGLALWDGSCLVRFAPDGTEERRVRFSAKKVSSLIFGGPDYTDIYVTTAGGDKKETEGAGAGALFRIRPGIRGVPEFPSRISPRGD